MTVRERASRTLASAPYQLLFGALAVVAVVLLILPASSMAEVTNLIVWALFVADYAAGLWVAPDRRRFVKGHLLELVAILPIDFLRAARALRVLRLIRVLRLGIVFGRTYRTLGGILGTNGLGRAIVAISIVILLAGLAIWTVEPEIGSPGDGLWWAFVTATTVGYGDISPASAGGRLIALVLMTIGIGLIGLVTGSVATFFLRGGIDERAVESPHITHLRSLLDRWSDLSASDRMAAAELLSGLADPTNAGTGTAETRPDIRG
jgi:voltage-gated potassium channel